MADESEAAPKSTAHGPEAALEAEVPFDADAFERAAAQLRPSWETAAGESVNPELLSSSHEPAAHAQVEASAPVPAPLAPPEHASLAPLAEPAALPFAATVEAVPGVPSARQARPSAPVVTEPSIVVEEGLMSAPLANVAISAVEPAAFGEDDDQPPMTKPRTWLWVAGAAMAAALVLGLMLTRSDGATAEGRAPEALSVSQAPSRTEAPSPAPAPVPSVTAAPSNAPPTGPSEAAPSEPHAPEQAPARADSDEATARVEKKPDRESAHSHHAKRPELKKAVGKPAPKPALATHARDGKKSRKGAGFVSTNPY